MNYSDLILCYPYEFSLLNRQITPWTSFLAMPSYRMIKDRKDEQAKTFKKKIIEEEEKRGKKAFAEYKRRKKEKRRGKKRSRKIIEAEEEVHKTEEEERKAKRRKLEKYAWRVAPYPCIDIPIPIKTATLKAEGLPKIKLQLFNLQFTNCNCLIYKKSNF